MKYLVSSFVIEGIQQFYENVAKKYKHTYDYSLMHKNIDDATTAIYKIETELLRRKPSISKWNGLYMANTDKWYFAYKIEGDTIYVEDARHAQNMHEGLNRVINLMERMDNLPKRHNYHIKSVASQKTTLLFSLYYTPKVYNSE